MNAPYRFKLTPLQVHLLAWVFFMLYETLSIGIVFGSFHRLIIYLAHYAVLIAFFYLHAQVILPVALSGGRHSFSRLPLIVAAEAIAYVLSQYLVSALLIAIDIASPPLHLDRAFVLRNSYRALFYIGFATGYYFLRNFMMERKRAAALEKARLEAIIARQDLEAALIAAENAFLKAQINPHFLFNTLDFVYHQVNAQSAVAGEVVLRLSEMMRFALDSAHRSSHPALAEELEQVENLFYLHRMRKGEAFDVDFGYSEAIASLHLIPLLVLTLAENMVKHGDLSPRAEPAGLQLSLEAGLLVICSLNAAGPAPANSTKTGLDNIRRRLQQAYGEAAAIQNGLRADGRFQVKVTVPVALLHVPA